MKRNRTGTALTGCLLTVMLSLHGKANAQYDVTPRGSFSPPLRVTCQPDPKGFPAPYMLVKAAIVAMAGDNISLAPGDYKETGLFRTRSTLRAPDGPAVIGRVAALSTTTLRLATLNTHLAGDEGAFFGYWNDSLRAVDIADICADWEWDFVGFSEIWDEDYFCNGCCEDCDGDSSVIAPILSRAGYPHGRVGDRNNLDFQHSGLAVMSRHPILGFQQYDFSDCPENPCDGFDCLANKGFVWATIRKGGFDIHIINTHMQADTGSSENVQTRHEQMSCIRARVVSHMQSNPDDVYFILGDLNVPGDSSCEYYVEMSGQFGQFFNDGAPNTVGFEPWQQYTNSRGNPLALCFDCSTGDNRFDYILYTPQSLNGSVTIVPSYTTALRFQGPDLTGNCGDCPDGRLTTDEKSDHWGVIGEYKIYRGG